MNQFKKYLPQFLILILFACACVIWYSVRADDHTNVYLKVAFLDIGQGDSVYIEAPNGRQMLIDGGLDDKVLSKLSEVMPFGDRTLDVLLATHTDADHIGGLPSVINEYEVSSIIENGGTSGTKIFQRLQDTIETRNVKKVIAHRGMQVMLDQEKNVYFEIIFPDRDVSSFTEPNDGSIVGKLVYGDTSFMLTGDATLYTENLIQQNETNDTLHSTVLKLGHHGSHTSSGQVWLEKVKPEWAIVSAGKHNRYGHPHKDVLDRLASLSMPYLATYDRGTIIFETDGKTLVVN